MHDAIPGSVAGTDVLEEIPALDIGSFQADKDINYILELGLLSAFFKFFRSKSKSRCISFELKCRTVCQESAPQKFMQAVCCLKITHTL